MNQKPLTLDELAKYNQEILFPALDDKFSKINDKFSKIDGEIKEKFDKVLTGQDKILKSIEDLKSDNTAGLRAQKRQEEKLENHEVRIVVMEKKLNIVKSK